MYYKKLQDNPLKDYNDIKNALLDLLKPYFNFMSQGCARIDTGLPSATFSNNAFYLEGFARILWGIIPYLAGGNEYKDYDKVITGISNGVNPEHPEFWGIPGNYDQLLVEMAAFGYALCLIPEKIWDPLSQKAKDNFSDWLSYINKKEIPNCNWIFFRILINCGLQKVGAKEFNKKLLDESFNIVEKFYIKDGWYNDGFINDRRARDYYIPWAIHYYSLIFAKCFNDIYPDIASRYIDRATLFAKDYIYWFSKDGSGLPYGRSLAYRFNQSSFWAALAFCDVEALPWGQIKRLLLQNVRWWFNQPIFSESGLLSVGYTYPNLHMAERYNSPNSPLWALKVFIVLAISEDHFFWRVEEEPILKQNDIHLQESTGFIISDSEDSGHLYALNAGQWTPGESNEHNHMAEKYSKFAYSNYFGFNVTTDVYGIDKLGHDNMLLISEEDRYYRFRTESYDHQITENYLYSKWKPFKWIEIETYLINYKSWHLRFHHLIADRLFQTAEGGFALPYNDSFYPIPDSVNQIHKNLSFQKTELGFSGMINLINKRDGKLIIANPNANIIHPHTIIPTLLGEHPEGDHWLGCAVFAHPDPVKGGELWSKGIDKEEAIAKLPKTVQEKLNL